MPCYEDTCSNGPRSRVGIVVEADDRRVGYSIKESKAVDVLIVSLYESSLQIMMDSLLVCRLVSGAHVSANSCDFFDRCRIFFGRVNAKNALDLNKLIVYCFTAVSRDKYHSMDNLQELWLPVWDEVGLSAGTFVA